LGILAKRLRWRAECNLLHGELCECSESVIVVDNGHHYSPNFASHMRRDEELLEV
jgi:hypothetical protein